MNLIKHLKRPMAIALALSLFFFAVFDLTSPGSNCKRSVSPDGLYRAERCTLEWNPGGSSNYVGRLFDAKTGKLLAQRTFTTAVPDLFWSSGVSYPDSSQTVKQIGPSVEFSRGDPDDGESGIQIPPSLWDKLLATRPRSAYIR
jgi:hypothetical protein